MSEYRQVHLTHFSLIFFLSKTPQPCFNIAIKKKTLKKGQGKHLCTFCMGNPFPDLFIFFCSPKKKTFLQKNTKVRTVLTHFFLKMYAREAYSSIFFFYFFCCVFFPFDIY